MASSRARIRPQVLIVGAVAAVAALVSGLWLGSQFTSGGSDDTDVVLTEPGEHAEPTPDVESQTGERLPDVELVDADGNTLSSGSLIGTPMVINVWHSNCAPCVREMPALAEVDAEYDEVDFVGINPLDDTDTMLEYADDRDVSYVLLRDERWEFIDAARVLLYPTTYFVDADGMIVEQHSGEIDAEGIRTRIEAMR